jgi:hypothetical protein
MLPTKLRFIWQSGFREEDFLEINQSETRIILSICNLPVKIEQMQDKTRYSDTGATSTCMFHFF